MEQPQKPMKVRFAEDAAEVYGVPKAQEGFVGATLKNAASGKEERVSLKKGPLLPGGTIDYVDREGNARHKNGIITRVDPTDNGGMRVTLDTGHIYEITAG